jgi:hypothetical protein
LVTWHTANCSIMFLADCGSISSEYSYCKYNSWMLFWCCLLVCLGMNSLCWLMCLCRHGHSVDYWVGADIAYPVGPENEVICEWWLLDTIRVVALSWEGEGIDIHYILKLLYISGEGFTLSVEILTHRSDQES